MLSNFLYLLDSQKGGDALTFDEYVKMVSSEQDPMQSQAVNADILEKQIERVEAMTAGLTDVIKTVDAETKKIKA